MDQSASTSCDTVETLRSSSRRPVGARVMTSAIFFANGVGFFAWAAFIPLIKHLYALNDAQLGVVLFGVTLGSMITLPTAGYIATALGSRTTSLLSGVLFGVAVMLPAWMPTVPFLFVAAMLIGGTSGLMDVAMNTYATVVERAWGKPIMSSFHAFFSVGGLLGAVLGSRLIALDLGLPLSMGLVGAFVVLMVLIGIGSAPVHEERSSSGAKFAFPTPAVFGIGLLAMLGMMGEGATVDWSGVFLVSLGATKADASAGLIAFSIAMTACRFTGDMVVHRLGGLKTVLIGGGLSALGYGIAIFVADPLFSAAGFILVGLGLANVVPVLYSAAGRIDGVPPGVGVAMAATLGYTGLLVAPPTLGFIAQHSSLSIALSTQVVFGAIIVIVALTSRSVAKAAR